ncbi:uncharacterized protein LOC135693806 [Rhopilema esculentum]|uniref:uncharacterized protein LOC135693806 n=1 Tax=Rhopilema esculentum TaxID=499914 RepID=UPI0031DECD3A
MAANETFTPENLQMMEKAYVEGLNSTNMAVHSSAYLFLSEATNIEVSKLKVWINNRKRKDRPKTSTFSSSNGEANGERNSLKKAPCYRKTSAWNVFLSQSFKGELKDVPKEEKSKRAQELYKTLKEEDKKKLEVEAENFNLTNIKDMSSDDIEKSVNSSMKRILKEMQYMEQFGCTGFSLVMKPNGKILSASTANGEEFIVNERQLSRRFSEYCNTPVVAPPSQIEARLFLNKKYSIAAGVPRRVPYKHFKKAFDVEGWPEVIPFKSPARMGQKQLEILMGCKEGIKFIIKEDLECQPAIPPAASLRGINCTVRNDNGDEDDEPEKKKAKRGKKISFVKKDDIVPVYASKDDFEGDVDEKDYQFWLFQCNGKVKTDGTISGRWLIQSEEDRTFIVLPQIRSIFETNVVVDNNKRAVLDLNDFECIKDGSFKLKLTTLKHLQKISSKL